MFPGHFWHYALKTTEGTKYLVLIKTFVEREGGDFEYTGVDMVDYQDDENTSA